MWSNNTEDPNIYQSRGKLQQWAEGHETSSGVRIPQEAGDQNQSLLFGQQQESQTTGHQSRRLATGH